MKISKRLPAPASKACLLAVAFALVAFPQETVVGTIAGVSGNDVSVQSGGRTFTFSTDAQTLVRKGKAMEPGDSAMVKYHAGSPGNLIADEIWLNLENHYAVITRVDGASFDVFTNPNADPQSAYKRENRTVRIDPDTVFEASAREDLKPGRGVQVIGVRNANGEILATRLIIYEGNRPVRMRSDARVVLPNGTIR